MEYYIYKKKKSRVEQQHGMDSFTSMILPLHLLKVITFYD